MSLEVLREISFKPAHTLAIRPLATRGAYTPKRNRQKREVHNLHY